MFKVVSASLNKRCQKLLVNTLSLSEISTLGILWSLNTLSMNNCATEAAVKGCLSGMKWPNFVNLSTITRIVSNLPDRGSPSIKSIPTECQASGGIGSGCSLPGSLVCSLFA